MATLLIHRGDLHATEIDNAIGSVHEFLESSSVEFHGRGQSSLFRTGDGTGNGPANKLTSLPLPASSAARGLKTHAIKVGLSVSGFHQMRKSFAMTITAAYGPDVAKTAFDHQMKHNALDQHYSSGVGLYDFAAMIYGEEVSPRADLVRSSKISAIQRSGQGPKALVHNASNPAPVGKRKVVIGRLDDLFLEKESYRAAFELLQELREQLERATGVDMTSQKKLRGRQFGLARRMLGDGAHDDLLSQAIEAKKNEGDIRRQLQGQMKRKASKEEVKMIKEAPTSMEQVKDVLAARLAKQTQDREHQDLQTSSSSCETSILLSRVPLVCALANDLSEGPLDLDLDLKSPDRQIDMSSHASTSPSLPGRRPRVHHQQHHDDGLDVPTLDPRTLATVAEMRTIREDSHARFDAVTVRLTAVEQQHQHRPERGEPVDNSVGIDPAATVDHGRRTSIAPIHPPPDRNRASADTAWSPALLEDRFVTTSRGPTRPRPAHPPITPRAEQGRIKKALGRVSLSLEHILGSADTAADDDPPDEDEVLDGHPPPRVPLVRASNIRLGMDPETGKEVYVPFSSDLRPLLHARRPPIALLRAILAARERGGHEEESGLLFDSFGCALFHNAALMTTRQDIALLTFATFKTVSDHGGYSLP
ncbi:unnamed protein product [Tilletia controversa]|nr:unnamed protein product [Tilletia controversa]